MRLFVALDIPAAVRDALAELRARLETLCHAARWVRLDGAHVTLKFIGEVPPEQVEQIRAALARVRTGPPLELRFAGLGFFPTPRRPRVFWAGIEPAEALARLAAAVEAEIAPLGVPQENRDFLPHLTLARFDSPHAAGRLVRAVAEMPAPEFGRASIAEFHLYRSVLKRGGAEYTRLATYPFDREPAS